MKRIIMIQLLFVMSCVIGLAQASLYKSAIKNGLNDRGVFRIENTKKKNVSEAKMRSYLQERGYIVGNSTTQEANIYGNVVTIVKSLEFVSPKDLSAYMFNRLNESNLSINNLSGNGTAFLAKRQEIKQNAIFYIKKYEVVYERIDDILWSGTIKEGFINGKGVGIAKKGNEFIYLDGSFSNGLPIEECLVKRVPAVVSTENASKKKYMGVNSETILENAKITDSGLSNAINLQLPLWYREDTKRMESAFQNALGLNSPNYKDYYENKYKSVNSDKFIAVYGDKFKYDPDNLLPKVKEMDNIKTALSGRHMDYSRDTYWGSRFLVGFCWWDDLENEDRTKIDNALSTARLGKVNSKYFKDFFVQVERDLAETKMNFEKKISNQKREFRNELENRDRRHKDWKQEMCDNCKIDGSKTTFPSGYVEGYRGIIIHTPAESKESGRIVLKNGSWMEWKYIYDDYKTYIKTDGFLSKEFDSVTEMMDVFIEKCKERYCE